MKLLITLELTLLFFATTFETHNTSGWYRQFLPVNCDINDMHFVDEKTGWIVSLQGHILKTTNSGDNWVVQKDSAGSLYDVQFLDLNTGYVLGNGNYGIFYSTSNGGTNWSLVHDFNPAGIFRAMSFANVNTGWVVSIDPFDGGVFKTTNAGLSWENQLNMGIDNPIEIFSIDTLLIYFVNDSKELHRTTDGGGQWNLIYSDNNAFSNLFFLDSLKGWARAGNQYVISYTTNGGFGWISASGTVSGGFDTKFINDRIGYSGTYSSFKILKSIDGGRTWGHQVTPTFARNQVAVLSNDTLNGWGGNLIHTTDGGGPLVGISKNENETVSSFRLNQNYPNPFNPGTKITFYLEKPGYAVLKVFDIKGGLVKVLIDNRLNSGVHETKFNADELPGGIYFYRLEMLYDSGEPETGSRKMILIR